MGQCLNPPTVKLSSTNGRTCDLSPVIISGNTFGGSATNVKITTNGSGKVSPSSTAIQPFDITYTPSKGDIGLQVIITVTTSIPKDQLCTAATASYALTINSNPSPPLPGIVTQPDCTSSTGNVAMSGLPLNGPWIITSIPGGMKTTGSGNNQPSLVLQQVNYTFIVTTLAGCVSAASGSVVINAQPETPAPPLIDSVIQPRSICQQEASS